MTKNQDIIVETEKIVDTVIKYITKNKEELTEALDFCAKHDREAISDMLDKKTVEFRRLYRNFALLSTCLPDEYLDEFMHDGGVVLYEVD